MMDGFGQIGRLPANTTFAELRSPDRTPSFSQCFYEGRGRDIFCILEIKDDNGRRLGALSIATHELSQGVCSFTDDEIRGNYHAGNGKDDVGIQERRTALGQQERPGGEVA